MKNRVGLFLGTDRGYSVLKELTKSKINVSSVLILKQQPHEINNFTEKIIDLCAAKKIPYETSQNVKSSNYEEYIKSVQPDVIFVISWRFLIPENCFNIPKFGMFNLHDALLPKYRGFAPTNWVIINGEKQTGLTLHYIDSATDNGDIVDQIKVDVDPLETAMTLNEKFLKLYPQIILQNLEGIFVNKNKRIKQNHKLATYICKRTPEDGKIDLNKTSQEIIQLVRGLSYPYPGAYCYYGDKKVIVWEAEVVENPPVYVGRIPGRIVNITENYVQVLTGDGIIKITKIGLEDNPKDFLKPNKILKSISLKLL